ncbi:hypothetical protein [Streptomyces sp. NPDC051219]|uniref:hypothetical protein n=1 Tax=Streptomyces sp. NPDC051219 TaxID=3155283 RepID=UPI0034333D29
MSSTAFRTAVTASTLATVSLLSLPAHADGGPSEHVKVGVVQDDRVDIANTLVQAGDLLEATS